MPVNFFKCLDLYEETKVNDKFVNRGFSCKYFPLLQVLMIQKLSCMTSEFVAVMFTKNKSVLQNLYFTLLSAMLSIDFAQRAVFVF
jgi:hypothetical protein